jgi:hypothetical protein
MTPETSPSGNSLKEAWKTTILAFLASRVLSGLFVYLGHIHRSRISDPGAWEGVSHPWLNPWTTYDSVYYLVIARSGYVFENITTAFFPFYPWLLKLGGSQQTGMAAAGVIISNLSFLFALFLLYRLTEIDFGPSVSKKTVWLLAFFPTTSFFSAVYAESIFLLLVLGSFFSARKGKWEFAGICGLLASLTRNPGALIFVGLALEYFRSVDYDLRRLRFPPLFFISQPLIGFIGMQFYLWHKLGIPMAGVASQQSFYRSPGWPWEAVWKDFVGFFTYLHFDLVTFLNLLVIFATVFLLVRFRRILRPSYGVFLIGLILMNLIYYIKIPPHTTGTARYILTAFPFFQLLALLVEKNGFRALARPMAGTYAYTCFLFSFLFGLKSFLG